MPRIFEVLKKENLLDKTKNKKDKANNPKSTQKDSTSFLHRMLTEDRRIEKKSEDYSLMSHKLIQEIKLHGVDNAQKAKEIYSEAAKAVDTLLQKIRLKEDYSADIDKIFSLLDDIFNQLILGDSILENIYNENNAEYYLPYHIVNVLVLSYALALSLGFNKSQINNLGKAVVFYDLGMDDFREIIQLDRRLNEEEYNLVKNHIANSIEIVDKIGALNKEILAAIQMHHERVNGSGYPLGMRLDEINLPAKIIGLVDTYAAMVEARAYRQGMSAHQAIRSLLSSQKDEFDEEVLRVFINKMSVYPIGSIVRLDTQELARVINVFPGSPLRPVVMIIQDANGEPAKETRIIDLSKCDFPSILDSI